MIGVCLLACGDVSLFVSLWGRLIICIKNVITIISTLLLYKITATFLLLIFPLQHLLRVPLRLLILSQLKKNLRILG